MENIKSKRKIPLWLWVVIFLLIIMAVMLNIGSKSSHYVASQPTKDLYTWKSGAVLVKGGVIPETCGLTTKHCSCNLTESMSSCTLNFNFDSISEDTAILVHVDRAIEAIIQFKQSSGCFDSTKNQIRNCSIDFQLAKNEPIDGKVSIVMNGNKGSQTLVDLNINAK